jgi:hypothetical protein
MDKHKGGRPTSDTVSEVKPPTLPDLGIGWEQSSRWQFIARIPEAVFEAHVAQVLAEKNELTTSSVLEIARTGPRSGFSSFFLLRGRPQTASDI